MELAGSCRCGAVSFTCKSHTPVPYLRCYCSICRKVSGCGYTVSIAAVAESLKVQGRDNLKPYRVMLPGESGGALQPSTSSRFFCTQCGCHLWAEDPAWSQLIYPFAGAIDTELPKPPSSVHLMLKHKAPWVQPQIGPDDEQYEEYPGLEAGAADAWGVEEWHRKHGLLVE